jgi:small subunit ribosomal protein S11
MGIQEVDLIVKGPGPVLNLAIRAVQSMGVKVRSISDITKPCPHTGLPAAEETPRVIIRRSCYG